MYKEFISFKGLHNRALFFLLWLLTNNYYKQHFMYSDYYVWSSNYVFATKKERKGLL